MPEVRVAKISFLGEQDGPVERRVKILWLPVLAANSEIRRAFLVRAAYEKHQDTHVVLALCASGHGDLELVEALRSPYADICHRDCPLDVAFVSPTEEAEIERVCPPFYTAF